MQTGNGRRDLVHMHRRTLSNSNSSKPQLGTAVQDGLVHSQVTRQAACPCNSCTEEKQVHEGSSRKEQRFGSCRKGEAC